MSTDTTSIKHLTLCKLVREEDDETEKPMYVFDNSDRGKWVREGLVANSGAFECVTSKKRMLRLRAEETPESRRGETWTCAGAHEINNEGNVTVIWRTDLGAANRGMFKVCSASRTLISVDRLQDSGLDVILRKNQPRNINVRTGKIVPLRKEKGMFVLDMWIWVPTTLSRVERCSVFARPRQRSRLWKDAALR